MYNHSRLAILTLLLCSLALAPLPARAEPELSETPSDQFVQSEELIYEGELTKGFLLRGLNIAELSFTSTRQPASQTQPQQGPTINVTMDAVSKGLLRKLFGLYFRQRIESKIETVSFTVLQTNKLDEQGKRQRISEAVFDTSEGKVVWTERDPNDPNRPPRVVTNPLSGSVQDIASAFYFLRTLPLKQGQSFELLISDSGQIYRTPVRVTERKKMKTVVGEVWTLRVVPEIFGEGRMLRGKGTMSLWYTDDDRRIPVKAQINNELGRLDIKLKKARLARTPIAAR